MTEFWTIDITYLLSCHQYSDTHGWKKKKVILVIVYNTSPQAFRLENLEKGVHFTQIIMIAMCETGNRK